MVEFKSTDVKKVGKVEISARRLKELAEKLEKVRETDANVEVNLYLVPNKEEGKASQIAFDFSVEKKEEVKKEEPKKEDVKVEEKPKEETKVEDPVVEKEVTAGRPLTQEELKESAKTATVVVPKEEDKTEKPVVEGLTDEEIVEKAKEINDKANVKTEEGK